MAKRPVSAQRLSALSTNTLTSVLELTRHAQIQSKPPSSLTTKINKNLSLLRDGIAELQEDQGQSTPSTNDAIVSELVKQYGRLVDLTEGLGVEARRLEASPRSASPSVASEGRLIDDDSVETLPSAHLPRTPNPSANKAASPLIPHTSIEMEAREAFEHEEDEIQSAQEVLQMQKRMMDNQDETLNKLSHAISRQRDLSINISDELEVHNRLLDETDTAIDRTESSLMRAGRRLEQVSRRHAREHSSVCIILGLVIVLVLLIAILK